MKGSTQAPHLHAANLFYFTILSRCHSSHVHANDYNMHLDVALNTIIHTKIYNHSSECSINSMPHETKTMHGDPTTTERHTAMHIYCQGDSLFITMETFIGLLSERQDVYPSRKIRNGH